MTDRSRILALARAYDDAPKGMPRDMARRALLDAVPFEAGGWHGPSGDGALHYHTTTIRLWVAAARRAAANPTRRKGPAVPAGRTERISVPATEATVQAVKAHAARTGRTRATVAGDFLEAGAKIKAGKGGEHD